MISAWLIIFFLGNKVKISFENYQKEKLNSFVIEEKRNKLLTLKRELPDLEVQKDNLDSMFVNKDEVVSFLRSLEKVAGDASCRIKIETANISKIKFEKKVSSAPKKEDDDEIETTKKQDQTKISNEKNKKEDDLASLKDYPAFSVEITGHFSSIVDFFEKFENMPYFIQPLIIDISSGGQKSTIADAGILPARVSNSSEDENPNEKDVKVIITFVVFTQ